MTTDASPSTGYRAPHTFVIIFFVVIFFVVVAVVQIVILVFILLEVIVLYLFLRRLSSTLIVSVSIPVSSDSRNWNQTR